MIKEDYAGRETYKLLKEKGYDGEFKTCYDTEGYTCPAIHFYDAMKWLREVHRIDIEVRTHYLNYLKQNDVRYYSGKILKGSEDVIHTIYSKDTYEEVCDAAIKYSLENLI